MLTNLFYYDYYRPYIFKNEKIGSKYGFAIEKTKSEKSDTEYRNFETDINSNKSTFDDEYSFYLSKAMKNEVINYAGSISERFNSIKEASKEVYAEINGRAYNFETRKENISFEMKQFVQEFNSCRRFAKENSESSPSILSYAQSLKYRADMDFEYLNSVGLSYDDYDNLVFDSQEFLNINKEQFGEVKNGLNHFFDSIYKDTCEIMSVPMAEHMNFKNLDLYYNYIYSNDDSASVTIIESGMIVDICL